MMLHHSVNYRRKGAINWHWLVYLEVFQLSKSLGPVYFLFSNFCCTSFFINPSFLLLALLKPSPSELDVTCVYFCTAALSFSFASVFLPLSFCNYRHVFTHLHSLEHAVCYTWRWSTSFIACGAVDVDGSCLFAAFFLNLSIPLCLLLTLAANPHHLSPLSFSFISSLINCSHLLSFRLDFLYVSLIFLSFLLSSSEPLIITPLSFLLLLTGTILHSTPGLAGLHYCLCVLFASRPAHTSRCTLAVLSDIILFPLGELGFG